jgi:hypothetical protein
MPQPIRKECIVEFDGFTHNQEHAMILGHIVQLSSTIDANLGYILAYLSGASAVVAIPMFHAVVSAEAQRAMLAAAAEARLAGAELAEFTDLFDDFKTRARERNRIVHNIWGHSPQHPGKSVWCHAKDFTRLPTHFATLTRPEELPLALPETLAMWRYCSLYTTKDFWDVHGRLMVFNNEVRNFVGKLLERHPALAPQEPTLPPNDAPPAG